MADTITWVNVASDFVKIGTGALIGGVIAIFSEHWKHRREKSSTLISYERDMLKDIVVRFGNYYSIVNNATYQIYLYYAKKEGVDDSEDVNPLELEKINELKRRFSALNPEASALYNELLLIKCDKEAKILSEINLLGEQLLPAYKDLAGDDNSFDEALEIREKINKKRSLFIEGISSFFKKV